MKTIITTAAAALLATSALANFSGCRMKPIPNTNVWQKADPDCIGRTETWVSPDPANPDREFPEPPEEPEKPENGDKPEPKDKDKT